MEEKGGTMLKTGECGGGGWQWNKGEHINRCFFKGNSSCGNVNKLWHFPAPGKKKEHGIHNIRKKHANINTDVVENKP